MLHIPVREVPTDKRTSNDVWVKSWDPVVFNVIKPRRKKTQGGPANAIISVLNSFLDFSDPAAHGTNAEEKSLKKCALMFQKLDV